MWERLGPEGAWALGSLAALAPLALWLAGRLGFRDPRPGAAPLERKRGQASSTPVGGLLLGGLVLYALLTPHPIPAGGALGVDLHLAGAAGLALVGLALAFGLVDDAARNGLSPGPKVLGQLAIGTAAAFAWTSLHGGWPASGLHLDSVGAVLPALAVVLGTLVVVNVVNTFDHADGLVLSMGALAFASSFPLLGAACLLLLPFNLRAGSTRLPKLFLGDSGSHLLGALIVVAPDTWPMLAVPALDLARVVLARLAAGQAPWLGDRRHLGQVLQRAGWSNASATAAVALAMAPAAPWAGLGASGTVVTALGYLALLGLARRGLAAGTDGMP